MEVVKGFVLGSESFSMYNVKVKVGKAAVIYIVVGVEGGGARWVVTTRSSGFSLTFSYSVHLLCRPPLRYFLEISSYISDGDGG